jgi:two-component system sensor histidine kinase DesK
MTLFATAVGVLSGAPISAFGQILIIIPAVGSFVYFLSRAVRTNQELRRARQEIARLAVSDERLRFARDLHDLLGHTLSLIALKSELARRLVSASPEQAATEIGDIETAARQALVEVREAVTGYRRATLENELNAAQELLAAAGIAFTQQGEPPPLTSSAKAALAWAVREGVTNVIRHSQARSCGVTLTRRGAAIALEVRDDGAASHDAAGGSGLAGLKERFAALGGSCEAGPAQGGGWRLAVSLPLGAEAAVTAATAPSGEKKVTPWFG